MKKIMLAFLMVFTFGVAFLVAGCCGDDPNKEFVSMAIKDGTMPTVNVGSTPNFSNVVVVISYDDESTEEIEGSDESLSFSTIDTSTEGERILVITYTENLGAEDEESHEIQVNVMVVPVGVLNVYGVAAPEVISDFNANKTLFKDSTSAYYVGDANEFIFKPQVLALFDSGDINQLSTFTTETTIEILEGDSFSAVSDVAYYVEVDNENQTLDFTENAINNTFRITMNVADSYPFATGVVNPSFSFVVEVVDGWNVYDVADLSAMDNRSNSPWAEIQSENGISTDVDSIILHTDLTITKDSVPSSFFYTEEEMDAFGATNQSDYDILNANDIDGSFKDYSSILQHNVGKNETFSMIGNYYSIDASDMPYVTYISNTWQPGGGESHAQLFRIEGTTSGLLEEEDYKNNSVAIIKNFNLFGNANKSTAAEGEDEILTTVKAGGLIMMKTDNINTTLDNMNITSFYISFFPQGNNSNYHLYRNNCYTLINNVVATDSYNCNIYAWGAGQVDITNSEITNSGGPAIIADHIYKAGPETVEDGLPTYINVENSTLESLVNGTESWFVQHGATGYVQMIQTIDQLFRSQSLNTKTLIAESQGEYPYLNFQVLFKHSSAEGPTSIPIRGSLTIDGVEVINFESTDPYYSAYASASSSTGAPLFMVDGDPLASYALGNIDLQNFKNSSLIQFSSSNTGTETVPSTSGIFAEDASEIGLLFPITKNEGFMGIALGYYNVEA